MTTLYQGDVHRAKAAVPGHGPSTGALQHAILLTVTIYRVSKIPSGKANQLTMDSRGTCTVHGWVLSVALFFVQ